MKLRKVDKLEELILKEYNKSQLIEDENVSRRQYEALLRQLLEILK